MADNVTLNQNITSGKVVATDDVSGAQYQRVKLDIGADGAASGTAGTSSTPLRVDPTGTTTQPVSAASLPLPSGASTDTKQDTMISALQAIQTALELIDNMISGSEAQVDVVSSALPSGASTSAKQDTIISHVDGIETLLTTVAGTVAGTEVQVDVLTMPTTTVTGTVAASQSGTWTVQPGNTANTTAWKVDGSAVTQPVSDAGGSLTVDGTIAATQSGTWNVGTVSTLTSITNAVAVTDNSSSLTVDNAGTFAVQVDGSALTALQLIDDPVATTASAIPSKGMAVSGTDGTNARILKTDTSGELQVDVLTMPTVTVTDGSGSLTVDGTVAATQSGTWNIATVTTLTGVTNVVHVDDNASSLSIDDGGNVISVDDGGSTLSIDDGAGSITVDNAGTFAVQATLAAGASTIAKAEDVASADADVGVPAMAIRKGTPANTSGTDGDYEMLQMSAGRLWTSTTVDAALPAGTNAIGKLAANSGVDIGDVDVTSTTLPTGGTPTSGTTSITTTASIQVHSNTACKMVVIQNDPDNTNDMLIGTTGAESIQLVPGQSISLPVSNVNLLYAKNVTSSTQTLNWISLT